MFKGRYLKHIDILLMYIQIQPLVCGRSDDVSKTVLKTMPQVESNYVCALELAS